MRSPQLVYTRQYRRRLEDIYEQIAADKPVAAPRVIERIRTAVERLRHFPAIGRAGRVEGTRELVISGMPYIVAYRLQSDIVEIITVLHSSQRWPERFP